MQWNTVARPVWQDNITDLKSHYRASQPPKLASLSKDDLIALCASLLPAWYDIQEVAVIKSQVDNDDDNAHLCPLQLPFIERCLRLYSNPNDLILDPFNGVGSTGHEAVRLGRRYVGIELNPAYFNTAVANLTEAERLKSQQTLFDYAGLTV
jgi:hypothetical protein